MNYFKIYGILFGTMLVTGMAGIGVGLIYEKISEAIYRSKKVTKVEGYKSRLIPKDMILDRIQKGEVDEDLKKMYFKEYNKFGIEYCRDRLWVDMSLYLEGVA